MAHYLVEYAQTGGDEARESNRPAHIAYRKGLGARLALAGPLLDEQDRPNGSVVIFEADDRAAAEKVANDDPYVGLGVFKIVSVRRYRVAAMKPPA
jgi:uncharacterized protein YciI